MAEEINLPRNITNGEKWARVIPIHDELKVALESLKAARPERVGPGQTVIFLGTGPLRRQRHSPLVEADLPGRQPLWCE